MKVNANTEKQSKNRKPKEGKDLSRYNRIARFYDIFEKPMESFMFNGWRKRLFERMENSNNDIILEIGVGTGKNIPFYTNGRYIALDISKKMIKKAKDKTMKLGTELKADVDFIIADVEFLPFRDDTFDKVFTTFVFCSVENPVKGLKEANRVLRKRKKAFFLEHMLPKNKVLQPIFHIMNLVARLMGPEINRRTDRNIEKAGFKIVEQEYLLGTVFRLIVAEKF
jgi:demethylmenaquinone methyltransferase/2-methoxy-6-polyprenyl-1,4-benzoquinol methylase